MRYGFGNTFDRILPRLHSVSSIQPNQVCHPFITAHEVLSGQTMGSRQSSAVCGLATNLKGIGTTNGSDLLTKLVQYGTKMWILCPIDDTTWSYDTYAIEFLSGGVYSGTYNNFVPADGSVNGVVSGIGKWFDSGIKPDELKDTRSVGVGLYMSNKTVAENWVTTFGTWTTSPNVRFRTNFDITNTTAYISLNTNSGGLINMTAGGFITVGRDGVTAYGYKNGVSHGTNTISYNVPFPPYNILFHAGNVDGVPTAVTSTNQLLSMYMLDLPPLNANEQKDLYDAVNNYQTNIIPGGRVIV